MSQAINTHTASTAAPPVPSRRSALRFIVAAIDAGMTLPILASPTPNKDAKLPRLCAAFRTQHRLVLDLAKAGGNAPDDALDWAMIERWGISDKIRTTPARTDGGKKAKSEVAIALLEENRPFGGFDGDIQFAYSVLLDVIGTAPATPVPALAWPEALFATSVEGEG
jgi:hypothetical protein